MLTQHILENLPTVIRLFSVIPTFFIDQPYPSCFNPSDTVGHNVDWYWLHGSGLHDAIIKTVMQANAELIASYFLQQFKDFTLDPNNFPASKMQSFVSSLHNNGQHYGKCYQPKAMYIGHVTLSMLSRDDHVTSHPALYISGDHRSWYKDGDRLQAVRRWSESGDLH